LAEPLGGAPRRQAKARRQGNCGSYGAGCRSPRRFFFLDMRLPCCSPQGPPAADVQIPLPHPLPHGAARWSNDGFRSRAPTGRRFAPRAGASGQSPCPGGMPIPVAAVRTTGPGGTIPQDRCPGPTDPDPDLPALSGRERPGCGPYLNHRPGRCCPVGARVPSDTAARKCQWSRCACPQRRAPRAEASCKEQTHSRPPVRTAEPWGSVTDALFGSPGRRRAHFAAQRMPGAIGAPQG
jgi:hypothetical protein